jgi:dihydrofolate synthase / folylpolyglutamate synthase
MTLSSAAEAIAFIERAITRPPDSLQLLPPRLRQAARFPYMLVLMDELGHPENALRVAHITGTSGKGSTATLIAAIAQAAGLRTGLYTSPYVTQPLERIQIDGAPIADELFTQSTNEVAEALTRLKIRLPLFEPHLKMIWVATMLVAFAHAQVDLAVIEVGMGGRYDETNIVHSATATITTIGFDHMQMLGDTLPAIAFHKAGIIKPGIPVISGVTKAEPRQIIAAEAQLAESKLAILSEDFSSEHLHISRQGTAFDYHDQQLGDLADCHLRLVGKHYGHNAALAIRTVRTLYPEMNDDAIRTGLQQAWLPGRFELVGEQPPVLLDVAHNPEKLHALAETVAEIFPDTTIWLVLGTMENKDTEHMIPAIRRLHPAMVICTEPLMLNRAVTSAAELAAHIAAEGVATEVVPNPSEAVQRAMTLGASGGLVLVTGSLYLVSQVREQILATNQADAQPAE